MNDWKPLLGRVSLFIGPPNLAGNKPVAMPSALDLFQRVWAEEPDHFQRPQNALEPSVAYGRKGELSVICTVQPARIDFTIAAAPPDQPARSTTPVLHLVNDTASLHQAVTGVAERVGTVDALDRVNRVAVYLQVAALSDDLPEANATLVAMMPEKYRIQLTDEDSFILQFNTHRPSGLDASITWNLINRWSVNRYQSMTLNLSLGGHTSNVSPDNIVSTSQIISPTVSFDYNTIPQTEMITPDRQSTLLLEGWSIVSSTQRELGLLLKGF